MLDELFSDEFLKDTNYAKPMSGTEKKARVFQTFMSDAELARRNIAITQPFINDDIGRLLFSDHGNISRNVPILHAVQYVKLSGMLTDASKTGERTSSVQLIALEERLSTLRSAAAEDGVPLSETSIERGMSFLRSIVFNVKPSLYLSANGNLRIVWSNDEGEQIALQIKGDKDEVQYIIFRKTETSERDQILGTMSSDNVKKLVTSLGMDRVIFRGHSVHVIAKR